MRTGGGGGGQARGGQIREQGLGGASTPGWLEVGDPQGRGSWGDKAGLGAAVGAEPHVHPERGQPPPGAWSLRSSSPASTLDSS